jgi:hypothetical protein
MAAQAQWYLSGDYFEVDSTGNRLRRPRSRWRNGQR